MYFSKIIFADIIRYAASKGATADRLYEQLGVAPPKRNAPMEYVSYDQMAKAIELVRDAIKDDFLGLSIGESFELKGIEQVNEVMQSSPTLELAFENAATYSKLISDALESSIQKSNTNTTVSFAVNPNWAVHQQFAVQQIIDLTLVCTFKSIFWLTQKKYFPAEVHLNYATPKSKNIYYRIFNCPIKFNQAVPRIIFPKRIFKQTLTEPPFGLLDMLKKASDEAITKIPTEPLLITQVKKIVLENLPQKVGISKIAARMCCSSRSLQRNLKRLGTSFKKVEKDILLKLARKLLIYEELNMDEISYLLGFSEKSAFIRFFNNAMDEPPARYKRLHRKKA